MSKFDRVGNFILEQHMYCLISTYKIAAVVRNGTIKCNLSSHELMFNSNEMQTLELSKAENNEIFW